MAKNELEMFVRIEKENCANKEKKWHKNIWSVRNLILNFDFWLLAAWRMAAIQSGITKWRVAKRVWHTHTHIHIYQIPRACGYKCRQAGFWSSTCTWLYGCVCVCVFQPKADRFVVQATTVLMRRGFCISGASVFVYGWCSYNCSHGTGLLHGLEWVM